MRMGRGVANGLKSTVMFVGPLLLVGFVMVMLMGGSNNDPIHGAASSQRVPAHHHGEDDVPIGDGSPSVGEKQVPRPVPTAEPEPESHRQRRGSSAEITKPEETPVPAGEDGGASTPAGTVESEGDEEKPTTTSKPAPTKRPSPAPTPAPEEDDEQAPAPTTKKPAPTKRPRPAPTPAPEDDDDESPAPTSKKPVATRRPTPAPTAEQEDDDETPAPTTKKPTKAPRPAPTPVPEEEGDAETPAPATKKPVPTKRPRPAPTPAPDDDDDETPAPTRKPVPTNRQTVVPTTEPDDDDDEKQPTPAPVVKRKPKSAKKTIPVINEDTEVAITTAEPSTAGRVAGENDISAPPPSTAEVTDQAKAVPEEAPVVDSKLTATRPKDPKPSAPAPDSNSNGEPVETFVATNATEEAARPEEKATSTPVPEASSAAAEKPWGVALGTMKSSKLSTNESISMIGSAVCMCLSERHKLPLLGLLTRSRKRFPALYGHPAAAAEGWKPNRAKPNKGLQRVFSPVLRLAVPFSRQEVPLNAPSVMDKNRSGYVVDLSNTTLNATTDTHVLEFNYFVGQCRKHYSARQAGSYHLCHRVLAVNKSSGEETAATPPPPLSDVIQSLLDKHVLGNSVDCATVVDPVVEMYTTMRLPIDRTAQATPTPDVIAADVMKDLLQSCSCSSKKSEPFHPMVVDVEDNSSMRTLYAIEGSTITRVNNLTKAAEHFQNTAIVQEINDWTKKEKEFRKRHEDRTNEAVAALHNATELSDVERDRLAKEYKQLNSMATTCDPYGYLPSMPSIVDTRLPMIAEVKVNSIISKALLACYQSGDIVCEVIGRSGGWEAELTAMLYNALHALRNEVEYARTVLSLVASPEIKELSEVPKSPAARHTNQNWPGSWREDGVEFIDIGANVGAFTYYLWKNGFPVRSFDALPFNVQLLRMSRNFNFMQQRIEWQRGIADNVRKAAINNESAPAVPPEPFFGEAQITHVGLAATSSDAVCGMFSERANFGDVHITCNESVSQNATLMGSYISRGTLTMRALDDVLATNGSGLGEEGSFTHVNPLAALLPPRMLSQDLRNLVIPEEARNVDEAKDQRKMAEKGNAELESARRRAKGVFPTNSRPTKKPAVDISQYEFLNVEMFAEDIPAELRAFYSNGNGKVSVPAPPKMKRRKSMLSVNPPETAAPKAESTGRSLQQEATLPTGMDKVGGGAARFAGESISERRMRERSRMYDSAHVADGSSSSSSWSLEDYHLFEAEGANDTASLAPHLQAFRDARLVGGRVVYHHNLPSKDRLYLMLIRKKIPREEYATVEFLQRLVRFKQYAVKIDVEGHEIEAMRGATKFLTAGASDHDRPRLVMSEVWRKLNLTAYAEIMLGEHGYVAYSVNAQCWLEDIPAVTRFHNSMPEGVPMDTLLFVDPHFRHIVSSVGNLYSSVLLRKAAVEVMRHYPGVTVQEVKPPSEPGSKAPEGERNTTEGANPSTEPASPPAQADSPAAPTSRAENDTASDSKPAQAPSETNETTAVAPNTAADMNVTHDNATASVAGGGGSPQVAGDEKQPQSADLAGAPNATSAAVTTNENATTASGGEPSAAPPVDPVSPTNGTEALSGTNASVAAEDAKKPPVDEKPAEVIVATEAPKVESQPAAP